MDFQNVDITTYQPSTWDRPKNGKHDMTTDRLSKLVNILKMETADITQHPYDPESWIRRAVTITKLRFPELAVGDAYKASLLCSTLLREYAANPTFKPGYRMGFWMIDETERTDEDTECFQQHLAGLETRACQIRADNLCRWSDDDKGRYFYQPYPWMADRHRVRDDKLLAEINREFSLRAGALGCAPACEVRRHAFGENVDDKDTSDVLGVFATRDIDRGETFLVDKTATWGCIGPGRDGNLPNGAVGCADPLHPNLPSEDTTLDLRWVRDRAGRSAAEAILRCRFLLLCVQDRVKHPLDHTLVARLTPHYGADRKHSFYYEDDFAIPNDALRQFGIDVFANLNYDTWILFTLRARIANNSWSDPIHTGISPLFSLFNHSCAPNVDWTSRSRQLTMTMKASQPIQHGEQMFVEYDSYMTEQPVLLRRQRLQNWLEGPCQCTRCVREEGWVQEVEQSIGELACRPKWDDEEERPVFPEDWKRR